MTVRKVSSRETGFMIPEPTREFIKALKQLQKSARRHSGFIVRGSVPIEMKCNVYHNQAECNAVHRK